MLRELTYQKPSDSGVLFIYFFNVLMKVISGLGLKYRILVCLFRFLNSCALPPGETSAREWRAEQEVRASCL